MTIQGFKKFIVDDDLISQMVDVLQTLESTVIMFRKPLYRVLISRSPFKKGGRFWIRVRTGDVGIDGNIKTTIDYKTVTGFGVGAKRVRNERTKELVVNDYEDAIQFLLSMGAKIASRQQNLRTKLTCQYEEHLFLLCIDVWPWIEDRMFVKISPMDKLGHNYLDDFIRFLRLTDNKKAQDLRNIKAGIDGVYLKEYGYELSEVENVEFEISKPQRLENSNNEFIEENGRPFEHKPKP